MNHTPQQKLAIEMTGKHICVDAGAGSGKTRVLIDRIVHLLEQRSATLDDIVAITFTDKAAAEMKDRLRRACREKAPAHDAREMTYWRELERQTDEARVMTIHSFCAGLLRENALALGFDPDFQLLEETESELLRHRVARETIEAHIPNDDAVLRAAAHSGSGTLAAMMTKLLGRTTSMARVVAELAGCDAVGLVERWARDAKQAFDERLLHFAQSSSARALRARLQRFDGECTKPTDAREVGRLTAIAKLDGIARSTSPQEILALLAEIKAIGYRGSRSANWNDEERVDELRKAQEQLKKTVEKYVDTDLDGDHTEAAQLTLDVLHAFRLGAKAYEAEKIKRRCLDFDDLIRGGLDLLETHDEIRARTAAGITHLLIDEFQDTDRDQLQIARLLRRSVERAGAEVFIVGDAKQSIYNFRGAEVRVFAEARGEAEEVVPLHKNFRSTPNVLNFVNDFFQQAGVLEAKGVDFAPLEAHRADAGAPAIEFLVPEFEKDESEKINAEESRRGEAALIASRLVALCNGGVEIFDDNTKKLRPARYGDCAILFRVSSNVHLYEEQLREYGIPYTVVTGGGFFDRQEVRDFSNLLKVLYDANDEMALFGFLRGPLVAMTDEAILELSLGGKLRRVFWSKAAVADPTQQERLDYARNLVNGLIAHLDRPLPELLREAIRRSSFEGILLGGPHGEQRVGNIRKVIDLAGSFRTLGTPALPAFIRYLDSAAAREFREGDSPLFTGQSGAVTLMTTHKAKGLEFPIVVVADLGRGKDYPRDIGGVRVHDELGIAASPTGPDGKPAHPAIAKVIKDAQTAAEDAEEARVFYVAMTRARDRLLLACGQPSKRGWSWSAKLDETYGILNAANGATIAGEKWTGTVHCIPDAPPKPSQTAAETKVDRDWSSQLQPIARPRPVEIISISELLAQIHGDESEFYMPRVGTAIDPLLRGTIIHAYLQVWNFSHTPPDIDAFVKSVCPIHAHRAKLAADLERLIARFRDSAFFARFQSASLQKELPFLLRLNGTTITGTIDVLLDNDMIVDYKTGTPRGNHSTRYATQLALYAAALERITGTRPREALLYYLDCGDIVPVDISEAASAEALDRAAAVLLAPANA